MPIRFPRDFGDQLNDLANNAGEAINDNVVGVQNDFAALFKSMSREAYNTMTCGLTEPTFWQRFDFDNDCNYMIEMELGENTYQINCLFVWIPLICLFLSLCGCGICCFTCRRG